MNGLDLGPGEELDKLVWAALGFEMFDSADMPGTYNGAYRHDDIWLYTPSFSLSAAIQLLEDLKNWRGEPIWWVLQRLPGRVPDEQYCVMCDGLKDSAYGPTPALAICRAILCRVYLAPAYIRGVWYTEKLKELGYSSKIDDLYPNWLRNNLTQS